MRGAKRSVSRKYWRSGRPSARRNPKGSSGFSRLGLEFSRAKSRFTPRRIALPLLAAIAVALALASLRIDLLRLSYAATETAHEERALLAEKRRLTARLIQRRDLVELSRRARELGFVQPDLTIDLSDDEQIERTPGSNLHVASDFRPRGIRP